MKVKTADLTGPALDWAVAKCEAVEVEYINDGITRCILRVSPFTGMYRPSVDWSLGGPLIEYYWVELQNGSNLHPDLWGACMWSDTDAGVPLWEGRCPTPLIAAMRCVVATNLGEEVEIPEELLK